MGDNFSHKLMIKGDEQVYIQKRKDKGHDNKYEQLTEYNNKQHHIRACGAIKYPGQIKAGNANC